VIGTRTDPLPASPKVARAELLAVQGLRKAWGDRVVIDRLELLVDRGSLVAIGGANGTGKTTLLRICAGLIWADEGGVSLDGLQPRRDRRRYQARVGFLAAADRGLYARLTAIEHLELWGRVSLLPRRAFRPAIERTVERLDLGRLAAQRMDRLSMGQRQRVRLAMAFLHEPDLVLLDEPLNSLDRDGAEALLRCVADVTARGGAVLWCAPEVGDEAPFDRRLVLADGALSEGTAW
jgi:ABC-2 type transport system ATP-binding protein